MWEITKEFNFSYGHRVWSQSLNENFSLDSCTACRFIHGHNSTVLITLSSDKLERGMVTDFKHLNWFKRWVDDVIDHKFIIDVNDPLREKLFPITLFEGPEEYDKIFQVYEEGYSILRQDAYIHYSNPEKEVLEGLVFVNFVPTSENLSKWLFNIVRKKMDQIGVNVLKVEFQETPKSKAVYREQHAEHL